MRARLSNMRLSAKMMLSYSALVVLPLILFGIIYYQLSAKNIEDLATKNISYANLSKRQLMDQQLRAVEDGIRAINADADLFTLLARTYETDYDIKQADTKITDIINKYFKDLPAVNTVNVVTEQYTYGSSTVVTAGALFASDLYETVKTDAQWISWIPTYYIPQQFRLDYLSGIRDESLFSFTAMAVMNPVSINLNNRAVMQPFPADLRKPVLIVNFSPDFFGNSYSDALGVPGAQFCVSDADGVIIAHSDPARVATSEALPWLEPVREGQMLGQYSYEGHRMLVSCELSQVTGWVMSIAVPMDELLKDVVNLLPLLMGLELLLVGLALSIVYIITRGITKPVQQLTGALKIMREGNFGMQIPRTAGGEIGYLVEKFNEMSRNIRVLINENYTVKLREKEAEITTLNTQLNPHLLYNTLNIINLEAIDRGEDEISRMLIALSRMLQYTVMNKQDLAELAEDIEWLKRYLYIMSLRYEGLFRVSFQFDEAVAEGKVPKLFLQPFVENAILHGFKGRAAGGEIWVTGSLERGMRVFRVRDNGKGIERERIAEILSAESSGVGIANVVKRVGLIYGGEARVSMDSEVGAGTTVTIELP